MSELEAKFRVSLDGKEELTDFFEKSERSAKSFQSTVGNAMRKTGEDIAKFGLSAAKSLASIVGFQVGIAAQAKSVLEFRDSIARLGTVAGIGEDKLDGLRTQILNVSVASGQMKEEVTDALNAFVAKTGDIDEARNNLELYGKTATGTGAKLKEVALIGAELSQKMHIHDQRAAMGILAKQGDIGAIEFKDLAAQGPRLFAAAAGAGLSKEKGVREIGGLAQLFAEGVGGSGSAARVATSIEGLFRDVGKKGGRKKIEGLGIEVGDRDAVEIVKDVVRKFGGNDRDISKAGIFTAASFRGVQTLSRDFRDHGSFTELDKFTNGVGTDKQAASTIGEKFERNTKSTLSQLQLMRAKAERLIDKGVDVVGDHPILAAAGGLGALVAKNALFKGGGGASGGLLGGLGGGVQKVFVVNQPGAVGGPGGVSGIGKGPGAALALGGAVLGAGLWAIDKWDTAGEERHAAQEDAGVGINANQLQLKNKRKAEKVAMLEKQGYSHGQAVFGAEHPDRLVKAIRGIQSPVVNVNIIGNHAEVTGTHDPKVAIRRGAR